MIKKLTAVILLISLCLSLFGCTDNPNEKTDDSSEYVLPTEVVESDVSLPYTSADKFYPYVAQSSLNRALIPVMYESLFKSTDNGKGQKQLCESYENDGKKITVKILENVKFSDETTLTSKDVKASFDLARENKYYSDGLKIFASVNIVDNHTIVFKLRFNDPMAINVLNFPICKKEGNGYLGTGKYSVSYLDKRPYLSVNTNHRDFEKSWNKQIALYDMSGISSPVYSFKANDITLFENDLSSDNYINLSSETISRSLNNLVYIGVNSRWKGSVTSLKWVRQAINIGINRREITASSFLGQGTATVTPFKSEFYSLEGMELPATDGEPQNAVNILERNGYKKINSDGFRTNGARTLSISILVCSKNEYKVRVAESVKSSLEDLGFKVTINRKKTIEEFKEALNDGKYGLYIGEVELTHNYDLSPFFTSKGTCNYGVNSDFYKEYSSYKNGKLTTTEFVQSFSTEVPFIPLFYRKSVVAVNPNVTGVDENDVYGSINNWKMSKKK